MTNVIFIHTRRGLISIEVENGKPVGVLFHDRMISFPVNAIRSINSIEAADEVPSNADWQYLVVEYVIEKEPHTVRTMLSQEAFDQFKQTVLDAF
jgi:hypothetical protein